MRYNRLAPDNGITLDSAPTYEELAEWERDSRVRLERREYLAGLADRYMPGIAVGIITLGMVAVMGLMVAILRLAEYAGLALTGCAL